MALDDDFDIEWADWLEILDDVVGDFIEDVVEGGYE